MSNLEKLKQKLMLKPTIREREPVTILIKGPEKVIGENEIGEKTGDMKEKEETTNVSPIIVDETNKGFNRDELLQKIKNNKMNKVFINPILETSEAKQIIEPIKETNKEAINIVDEAILQENLPKTKNLQKKKKLKHIEIEETQPEIQPELQTGLVEGEEGVTVGEVVVEEKQKIRKKGERITQKPEKGVAILGPETNIMIGDTILTKRLPTRAPPINIKVSNYYMNNREIFVNFINSVFEPYRLEIQKNEENISCDNIGKTNTSFSLLTHQKIVRDYMNMYTPYRGLLLYHGLGAGKTATSIAIAEGMKDSKRIIIMTPASLQANYREELKKAGDLLYKKNQFWEWIPSDTNPETIKVISAVLNLPMDYIRKQKGAWFINASKKSNYDELTDDERKVLDEQLDKMIKEKYTFINYNGLRSKRLEELTQGHKSNLFDNTVVIIDEAHNLISRIVNKLKKEKPITENTRGEKEHLPLNLSTKLYEYLLSAKNARIVLLSGTPIINYPNEFGILFNILRGYIKTWSIPLNIKTANKIDKNTLSNMLLGEKTHDYLDYSPTSKILTITRNPFGFKNKVKSSGEYQGVNNVTKDDKGNSTFETDYVDDDAFEKKIFSILHRNDIDVVSNGIKIQNKKALPDDLEQFYNRYIDASGKLKNTDALKRRIIGLSSYFKSAQESLLPKYNKTLGVDYHISRIPMSNFQFRIYESARREERKSEMPKKPKAGDELKEPSSTYRIFSRLFCNYVMPNRPMPKDIVFENSINRMIKDNIRTKLNFIAKSKIDKILSEINDEEAKTQMLLRLQAEIEKKVEIIYNQVIKDKEESAAEKKELNKEKEKEKEKEKKKSQSKKASDKEKEKEKEKTLGKGLLLEEDESSNLVNQEQMDEIREEIITQMKEAELVKESEKESGKESGKDKTNNVTNLLNEAQRLENRQDVNAEREGEIEGDEILDEIGGETYKARLEDTLRFLKDNSNEFLTPEALQTYSPKFLTILENIQDPDYKGLHLLYSQFRTLEGIGIFTLVLDKNGFTRFKIKKNSANIWELDISEENMGKPTYALYTGTETSEEKEIIRHIYNGEWDQIPDSISSELDKMAKNNNMGEIIKVLMITSSGSEGINLRNTRYVHIMEPYWHPVRLEQVIGRARRICSHKELPKELQTVEVFVYLMIFTDEQLKSDDAIELKRKDLSRHGNPPSPLTSDQNLYEISEIKENLTKQLTDAIKETAFDCYIYSNGKCLNFGDPTVDKFSYVPDYAEQQNDTTVRANKVAIEWTGEVIQFSGVDYIGRRINKKLFYMYDKKSYEAALKDPTIIPIQIGTLEVNERGEYVFKQLVT